MNFLSPVIEFNIRRHLRLGNNTAALWITDLLLSNHSTHTTFETQYGSSPLDPLLAGHVYVNNNDYTNGLNLYNIALGIELNNEYSIPPEQYQKSITPLLPESIQSTTDDINEAEFDENQYEIQFETTITPICSLCEQKMYLQTPTLPLSTAICTHCHGIADIDTYPRLIQIIASMINCYYKLGKPDEIKQLLSTHDITYSFLPYATLQILYNVVISNSVINRNERITLLYQMLSRAPDNIELILILAQQLEIDPLKQTTDNENFTSLLYELLSTSIVNFKSTETRRLQCEELRTTLMTMLGDKINSNTLNNDDEEKLSDFMQNEANVQQLELDTFTLLFTPSNFDPQVPAIQANCDDPTAETNNLNDNLNEYDSTFKSQPSIQTPHIQPNLVSTTTNTTNNNNQRQLKKLTQSKRTTLDSIFNTSTSSNSTLFRSNSSNRFSSTLSNRRATMMTNVSNQYIFTQPTNSSTKTPTLISNNQRSSGFSLLSNTNTNNNNINNVNNIGDLSPNTRKSRDFHGKPDRNQHGQSTQVNNNGNNRYTSSNNDDQIENEQSSNIIIKRSRHSISPIIGTTGIEKPSRQTITTQTTTRVGNYQNQTNQHNDGNITNNNNEQMNEQHYVQLASHPPEENYQLQQQSNDIINNIDEIENRINAAKFLYMNHSKQAQHYYLNLLRPIMQIASCISKFDYPQALQLIKYHEHLTILNQIPIHTTTEQSTTSTIKTPPSIYITKEQELQSQNDQIALINNTALYSTSSLFTYLNACIVGLNVKETNYSFGILNQLYRQLPTSIIGMDYYAFFLTRLGKSNELSQLHLRLEQYHPNRIETNITRICITILQHKLSIALQLITNILSNEEYIYTYHFGYFIKSYILSLMLSPETITTYKQSRLLFGRSVHVESYLCTLLSSNQQLVEALNIAYEIHQKAQNNSKSLTLLGSLLLQSDGNGNINQAQAWRVKGQQAILESLRIDPTSWLATSILACYYRDNNRLQDGIVLLEKFVHINNNNNSNMNQNQMNQLPTQNVFNSQAYILLGQFYIYLADVQHQLHLHNQNNKNNDNFISNDYYEKASMSFYTALSIDKDATQAKIELERLTTLLAPKSFPMEDDENEYIDDNGQDGDEQQQQNDEGGEEMGQF